MPALAHNRRRHERLAVPPMYAGIRVRLLTEKRFTRDGHTYDISEGGVQFELDGAITPGTPIAIRLTLPSSVAGEHAGEEIEVFGNVVWADESEPGPVRHAAVFSRFASEAARDVLLASLRRSLTASRAA
ncbi:MAG: PilZ domain-containing protein [Planctomycetota bacterium]|nr:PilZ domain-containing protein [Planctomycetota bacterium]